MPRTPLANRLHAAVAHIAQEKQTGNSREGEKGREFLTRRDLLKQGAAAGITLALGAASVSARSAGAPRIVIVGAGLAGLTCAYRLKQAGYIARIYEAADRIGGRCWTGRGAFADGQIYEHGGELIDTGHRELRRLIRELGLDTVDLLEAEAAGTDEGYFFDGSAYSHAQATKDFKAVKDKLF